MRALIAEDEFLNRKVLSAFLAPLFEEVDVAVTGKEALDAFRLAHENARPYDIIFMDIMMPEMDGIEALKAIRAAEQEGNRPRVKVLMVTALDDPKTVIRSFHDGEASGYIVKPLRKEKLFEELKKLGFLTE